jgi:hypothetical protein|tara:strand:+ start:270 stop:578 length:309 start_codon:yes stop_codon:yes gene_type:complete
MIRLAGLASQFRKKVIKENEAQYQPFDYKYYKDQVASAIEVVETMEEELQRDLQQRSEDEYYDGQLAAQQAEQQVARYITGAQKQLDGISNMLDRLENRGEL